MRDSQRSKVYKAETEVFGLAHGPDLGLQSVADVSAYIARCQREAWFKNRFPVWTIGVRPGKGARHATAGFRSINLPLWARTPWVIWHEVAHCLMHGNKHGRDFARVYLMLVRRYVGENEWRKLRAAFISAGVKHTRKRFVSHATHVKLRERGKALAAARKSK